MKSFLLKIIRGRHLFGLYLVNFVFQKILRITSQRVRLLHFTNVISAEDGFELTGEGELAERCLRINGGIMIQAGNGVRLHRSCLLGPGVKIISGNHDLDDFASPSVPCDGIQISERCWIGANVIILPDVESVSYTHLRTGNRTKRPNSSRG